MHLRSYLRCRSIWTNAALYGLPLILLFFHITTGPVFAASSADGYKSIPSYPTFMPAKAAIVVDSKRSVLYAKNSDTRLSPASTTKLVTVMVVLDHLKSDSSITVSRRASRISSVSPRLRANQRLTVSDLLSLALMRSVNSAAVALAEGCAGSEKEFAHLMNLKAVEIGAFNTRFANASGLPGGLQYTTVSDLAIILEEALRYPLIREILGKRELHVDLSPGKSMRLQNTNKLLWMSESVIGGKTGFTNSAQHCFVGAIDTENGPVISAILGAPSRNVLWKGTELLFSLNDQPRTLESLRLEEELVKASKVKVRKKVHRKYAKKNKHKKQITAVSQKQTARSKKT